MEKGKISSFQMAVMMYPTIVATVILSVPSTIAKYTDMMYGCLPFWLLSLGM